MGIIYKVTNKENGKIYIGQTIRNISVRKSEHYCRSNKKDNNHFHNALRKYDRKSFEWKVILICEDSFLDYYEKKLIDLYGTSRKEIGYNTDGGGQEKRILSDTTRNKMSASRKRFFDNGGKTIFHSKDKNPSFDPAMKEIKSKKLRLTYKFLKDDEIVIIDNLKKFCKDNNLCYTSLHKVSIGKQKTHNGYTIAK